MEDRRPTLHVIAGPNGAGKTTLYRNRIKDRYPEAEFVNADELAQREFGHSAKTLTESQRGQELAEQRRQELMAGRKSLVTETTFSHPSKLDLVKEAKQAGYEVIVYHVNVRSAELSVKRVEARVAGGGHPVPEDRIRQRYERNQPLIREAAKLADRAYIFDNSALGKPHTLTAILAKGKAVRVDDRVPAWARELYADEFKHFSQSRLNRPAASFAEATQIAKTQLGDQAKTYIPRQGQYTGPMIGETDLHIVQKIGNRSAVAHFRSSLDRVPPIGEAVEVQYDKHGKATVRTSRQVEEDKAEAETFRTKAAQEGVKVYPDLGPAYALVKAAEARVGASRPSEAARVAEALRNELAGRLERGERLPEVRRVQQADRTRDRGGQER
ncbi:hypothetical protein DUT91_24860 [Phyllobacterium salinisoli]|uniref:Uncharacterized protein n=1 Tax=Phyllobacterium salinisoli TaxID=1899321 RepID=A0A368JYV1_9HYPH|nr:zeta toxin family protein [Phyllobacterium salinisoli]RCS21332.1 hypothetical protein DUT91_24860 [Phyllobacterium salinisoli]